jgi:tetraacyldisaccharide 4'-kinase
MITLDRKWPNILLLPLAVLYYGIITVRNWLYDISLLKRQTVSCKVISVGNITVGGTGKTPTVEFLAKAFVNQNLRVCVISRGYKRQKKGFVLVSDGRDILTGFAECGDEPYLLAKKLLGVPVIVDENRNRAAQFAITHFSPDVILLDDGFQHRRIARDVDIVLIDSVAGFGNGWLLPAGPLRETVTSLQRAQLIVFTKFKPSAAVLSLKNRIQKNSIAPLVTMTHNPVTFIDLKDRAIALQEIKGKKILAFCGIARPNSFFNQLEGLGAKIVYRKRYKDHYEYTSRDKQALNALVVKYDAEYFVTTEKDRVRFSPEDFARPVWALVIEVALSYGETELWDICAMHKTHNTL